MILMEITAICLPALTTVIFLFDCVLEKWNWITMESHCVSSLIISVDPKNKMNLNVLLFLSSLFAAKQCYVAVLICKESSISHIQECRKTLLLQSICSSHICLPLLIFQENTPSNVTQFVSYRLVCTLFSFFFKCGIEVFVVQSTARTMSIWSAQSPR